MAPDLIPACSFLYSSPILKQFTTRTLHVITCLGMPVNSVPKRQVVLTVHHGIGITLPALVVEVPIHTLRDTGIISTAFL